ncbi:MAG: HlyD family efflux transporter periplasmic adaptor subunit [Woeseiaceae bacterium]|nr:HlyD family efflux transporter periplasmic adaptor subunit [Woeseiaceae bacterium]
MNALTKISCASLTLLMTLLGACDATENAHEVVGELASDRVEVSAEFSEPVVEILALEGDAVVQGQVLLRQDTARARAELAAVEAALAQQQARLDELVRGPRSEQIAAARASFEGATRELAFRSAELKRITNVHDKGLASAERLDSAKAALDAARADYKRTDAALRERLSGTTVEELEQAEQALKQAEARRDSAAINLERLTLKAPVDGLLDSRLFELGERPLAGQPVFIMLAGTQAHARVFVPEALRARIKTGTRARVRVDGIAEPIDGRVRWVASEPAFTPYYALTERDRGRLSYVAKVDLAEGHERLPDGVPVNVEFLLDPDG